MELYRLKKQLLFSYKQIEKLNEEKAERARLEQEEQQQKDLQVEERLTPQELDIIAQELGFSSYEAVSMSDLEPMKETNTGGIGKHVH